MYELSKRLELTHPTNLVWHLISDPLQLAKCVPGMTELVLVKPNTYRMNMQVKTGLLDTKAKGLARVLRVHPDKHEITLIGEGEGNMKGVEVMVLQDIQTTQQQSCILNINIKISGIPSANEHLIMSLSAYYFDQFVRNIQLTLEGKPVDLSLHAGAMIGNVLKNKLKGWFS